MAKITLAQFPEADDLLSKNNLALMIGMILDQQVTIEKAFRGPFDLSQRIGHMPSAQEIADLDTEKVKELFSEKPALHRFPGSMAQRVQDFCQIVASEYDGKVENIWETASDGEDLYKRIKALPGFGEQKAKIFVALLHKQLGVKKDGLQEVSKPFADEGTFLSVADITSEESLAKVRDYKKKLKAAAKAKKS